MVDLLNYFSFQPVLHNWCNKGCDMYYPVCGMLYIKDPLLLELTASFHSRYNKSGHLPHVLLNITVNKMC